MPLYVDISEHRELYMQRFLEKIQKTDYCWIWVGAKQNRRKSQPHPYGVMAVQWKPRYAMLAHRLSWELHFGKIPDGLGVLHKCDNPPCVNPEHLFLGTQRDNMQDCVAKGRKERGELCGRSVLKPDEVLEIRAKYKPGAGYKNLAEEYGVGKSTIEAVVKSYSWKHLPSMGQNLPASILKCAKVTQRSFQGSR